jgi:pimeloyl-ACP methyl ester carboxylesterase
MSTRSSLRRIAILVVLTVGVTTFGFGGGTSPAAAAPIPEPDDDPFYVPPAGFESTSPGTILRSRSVTVTGLGIPLPVRSTQMLVRSTDAKDQPVAVVSTLMVPATPYVGTRPLLSYQTATDSLGDQCNPSYTLRTGTEKELALLSQGLTRGWAVVVTDHQGPRDAFAAGRMAGHATLDGIRAAERLSSTGLAGAATPVGLWGYSGGALATGWAAELQPTYAPELNVEGVASGGTPADLEAAGRTIDGTVFSGLFLAASVGVSREYPELLSIMNDEGHALIDEIGDMCIDQEVTQYPFRRLNEFTTSTDPLSEPVVQEVLALNHMGSDAPTAPVYLYHSLFDQLVPHASAQELHSAWCGGGTRVQLYTDILSEHAVLAVTGAPAAVNYLNARFMGVPAPSNC